MGVAAGPNIVRESLAIAFDTDSEKSYPGSGSSIKNLINNAYGTLSGSPTFDALKNNTLNFNGTSQRMALGTNVSMSPVGFTVCMCINVADSQSSSGWNYWFLQNANDGHKYEFGTYGTGGNNFHFKDNYSASPSSVNANMGTGFSVLHFGSTSSSKSFYSVNGASKSLSSGTTGWTGGNDIIFDEFFYNGSSSYYAASVGNILVYSKELSDAEITQNYNALKTRFDI
tara:strand:- start:315 stop:998 length:684 start_codon:yes stop_codon:yes gene_type:complete